MFSAIPIKILGASFAGIDKLILKLMQGGAGGASLVAQLYRICLLLQETRVPSLIWEDLPCRRASKPSTTPTEPVL